MIEYALYEMLRECGIWLSVVMGHSVREYVAACVAGVFGLEDGLRLIAARFCLMAERTERGRMAAVFGKRIRQRYPPLPAWRANCLSPPSNAPRTNAADIRAHIRDGKSFGRTNPAARALQKAARVA